MTDFDQINGRRRARETRVPVLLDGGLAEQIADARVRLRVAEQLDDAENRVPEAPSIRAELEALEQQADDAVAEFVFVELPRRKFRDLVDAHPDPDGKLRWDEDGFAPALLAAAASEPALTEAQAQTIWDEWGTSVAEALFAGAWAAQEGEQRIPFGLGGSRKTRS